MWAQVSRFDGCKWGWFHEGTWYSNSCPSKFKGQYMSIIVNIVLWYFNIFHNLQLLSSYMLLSSWNDTSPGHNIAPEPRLGLRPPAFADASFRKLEVHGGSLSFFKKKYMCEMMSYNKYNKWHAWNNGHSIMCLEIWSWRSTSCDL